MLLGYYHQLLGSDPLRRLAAAKSWFRWEMGIYSNGFRTESNDSNSSEDGKNGDDSSTTTPLLVWNPHTSAWSYEDALVWNNESMISIDDVRMEKNWMRMWRNRCGDILQPLLHRMPPLRRNAIGYQSCQDLTCWNQYPSSKQIICSTHHLYRLQIKVETKRLPKTTIKPLIRQPTFPRKRC